MREADGADVGRAGGAGGGLAEEAAVGGGGGDAEGGGGREGQHRAGVEDAAGRAERLEVVDPLELGRDLAVAQPRLPGRGELGEQGRLYGVKPSERITCITAGFSRYQPFSARPSPQPMSPGLDRRLGLAAEKNCTSFSRDDAKTSNTIGWGRGVSYLYSASLVILGCLHQGSAVVMSCCGS